MRFWVPGTSMLLTELLEAFVLSEAFIGTRHKVGTSSQIKSDCRPSRVNIVAQSLFTSLPWSFLALIHDSISSGVWLGYKQVGWWSPLQEQQHSTILPSLAWCATLYTLVPPLGSSIGPSREADLSIFARYECEAESDSDSEFWCES